MNKLLAIFIGLQIADLITTVIFLTMGVEESNPVVKFAIHHLGTFSGLLMIKSTGIALGIWWYKRGRSMVIVNSAYTFLIFWNLAAIALISIQNHV